MSQRGFLHEFFQSNPRRHDAPKAELAPPSLAVQNTHMRANVNLDADVYTFASTYASAKGIPLGTAISELLRRAEQASEPPSALLTESRLGLLVRSKQDGEKVLTPDMVKELSEEDLA